MNRDRKLIFLTVLYFAILGCFLLGCSEGTDSSPVSALMGNLDSDSTGTSSITGTVLNSSGNTGMSNIYVQLYNINNQFVKGELTDSDGNYTFTNIQNGTYTVRITADGYLLQTPIPAFCIAKNGATYPEKYVLFMKSTSGASTSDDVFATVKGVVKRSDNSSAANTTITLCSDKNGNARVGNFETLVLGDGSFSLFNVPAGKNYFIRVGDSSSDEKTIYPIGIDNDGNVSPSDISITVNVTSQATTISTVTFKVVSAYTGASLELATIKINGENIGATNINGKVSVNNLSTGLSSLEITKEGFETLTSSRNFVLADDGTTITLTMVEDTKDGYGSITGRFVEETGGSGIGERYVRLYRLIERTQTKQATLATENIIETYYDVDKNFILTTKTSNGSGNNGLEGSFKLTHIEPGYYQIYISDTADIPTTEQRSQVYDDFVWTQIVGIGNYVITQPLKVVGNQTTYWTNYEQGNN